MVDPVAGSRHFARMIRFILILLLAGCADMQTAQGSHPDHPPKPELIGQDVQAIARGMQRSHRPERTEMVAPARPPTLKQ